MRLDSGDLLALSRETRLLLDEAGLGEVEIFVSGGLDEHAVADLVSAGTPIDGFGVGTSMGVSDDAPTLDIAYKLCEYAGEGRLKLSSGKPVLPGRKQVFRINEGDESIRDVIARADEELSERPLLALVMRKGRRLSSARIDLTTARAYAKEQIDALPARVRALADVDTPYPVEVSAALGAFQASVKAKVAASSA